VRQRREIGRLKKAAAAPVPSAPPAAEPPHGV